MKGRKDEGINFVIKSSKHDWLIFNKQYFNYINKRKRWFVAAGLLLCLCISMVLIFLMIEFIIQNQGSIELFGFMTLVKGDPIRFIGPIVYLILTSLLLDKYFFSVKRAVKKMMNHPENSSMFESKRVYINENVIQYSTRFSESTLKWEAIIKILESSEFIAIFIEKNSCLLFPKRKIMYKDLDILDQLIKTCYDGNFIKID